MLDIHTLDFTKYWVIHAYSVEWMYVFTTLTDKLWPDEKLRDKEIVHALVQRHPNDPAHPMWILPRVKVPVEEIMRLTGLSQEAIEGAKYLKLRSKARPELPEPTVNGWGIA